MPQIVPIKEMKNTSAISEMAHASMEPIFITKNGYGDMVVMSMEAYEAMQVKNQIYRELEISERQVKEGKVHDARLALNNTRAKYGL